MKKIFILLTAISTVSFCTKTTVEKVKPEVKKAVVIKETLPKGSFKVGYAGSNPVFTKNLKDVVTTYTQDVTIKSKTGVEYFKLPSGLALLSSDKFNSYVRESAEYKDQVAKLKKWLLDNVRFGKDNLKFGYYYRPNKKSSSGTYYKFDNSDNPSRLITNTFHSSSKDISEWIIIILDNRKANFKNAKTVFDAIFSQEKIEKLYNVLQSTQPTKLKLIRSFWKTKIKFRQLNLKILTTNTKNYKTGRKGELYINKLSKTPFSAPLFTKTLQDLATEFQAKTKTALDDKTKLAAKNLDALFVQVTDGVENSVDVYKSVVEKKEFGATKLFFVGDKAKSQSGASSKVFAGGHVSTASFNKYAAAYVAGFQAAVGTIKYSSSEDVYEETITSFLIGSTWDWEAKKKAFSFRRGVEAAAAHSAYSKYLKVKFVSKTEDSSKSSKKLYREVSEWKARKDSKSKLYEFASSDTFSDADRRVIYLAGTTSRDWTGLLGAQATTADVKDTFQTGDDTGLIGALYNYDPLTDTAKPANSLTSKTFSRGVWVVLDKAFNKKADLSTDWKRVQNTYGISSHELHSSFAILSDHHNLWQVRCFLKKHHQGITTFERHDVKFYGAIGEEGAGITQYVKFALKGLYMGGPNYILGKHTIFGAQLDNSRVTKGSTLASNETVSVWTKGGVWGNATGNTSGGKDSADKARDRYSTSLGHAWEKEIREVELVKASPWLK